MKYSLVKNKKVEAFPKGRGVCICCQGETVSKCGPKIINHWAHKNLKHCDNWWDNETEWHRQWKSYFPVNWQEIVHFDDKSGEKHIADVKTDSGFILEFQNSPMPLDELKQRESFYKKMIWIVNAKKFEKNFHILGKLPNPNDSNFQDFAFWPTKKDHKGRSFWKYSENPNWEKEIDEAALRRAHSFSKIEKYVENSYIGHHLFEWKKPRYVWFQSNTDVFLDFGDKYLWKLMKYGQNKVLCVRKISKDYFIERAKGKNKT